jgi:hypothetical protein
MPAIEKRTSSPFYLFREDIMDLYFNLYYLDKDLLENVPFANLGNFMFVLYLFSTQQIIKANTKPPS